MNITVIGSGKSGKAAAKLAKRLGHNVFLTESKQLDTDSTDYKDILEIGVPFEMGGNTAKALEKCELVISSPGVPPHAEIIKNAQAKGIKIISELEFACRYLKNPIIGITGTNGKTTTTTLTTFILNNAGKKAISAGNIGLPLCELVDTIDVETIIVAELSSFQLDRTDEFCPNVAMILNISPDHLYYHGTMEEYSFAKWKISLNQTEKNLLILNGDDKAVMDLAKNSKASIALFGLSTADRGIFLRDGKIIIREEHKEEELMLQAELGLPGVHNAYNSMAAALAARAFEVSNEDIRDSLMRFTGVEHRLEYVRNVDGVEYINDSKATNVNATWFALTSYENPLIWIAGGRGDSNDYSLLDDVVEKHVKSIIAIGDEADAIFNHFCTKMRCRKADSMEKAVQFAREEAEYGDIVLFTPACKSFDWFMNYEHRGEVFKEIVGDLK